MASHPDDPLRELVDASGLRRWLTRAIAFDILRTAPLVGFVALFAFGPLGAVRAAFEWRNAASDCALLFLGAVVAVLPAAILLLTILVGLVCDAHRTCGRFNEVFSGTGGGMRLVPEPITYRSV
ncbi:MAG: hypothetical protein FWD69_02425 [Polyangiaceae bacterium]|nr:hypothetical protein [Polyangiaceae bacterium]